MDLAVVQLNEISLENLMLLLVVFEILKEMRFIEGKTICQQFKTTKSRL